MLKERWLIVSAFVLFLAEIGLQMSGIQNLNISYAIWLVAFLVLVWAIFPAIRGIWDQIKSWTEAQKTLALFHILYVYNRCGFIDTRSSENIIG
jgi:cation transport ATPase